MGNQCLYGVYEKYEHHDSLIRVFRNIKQAREYRSYKQKQFNLYEGSNSNHYFVGRLNITEDDELNFDNYISLLPEYVCIIVNTSNWSACMSNILSYNGDFCEDISKFENPLQDKMFISNSYYESTALGYTGYINKVYFSINLKTYPTLVYKDYICKAIKFAKRYLNKYHSFHKRFINLDRLNLYRLGFIPLHEDYRYEFSVARAERYLKDTYRDFDDLISKIPVDKVSEFTGVRREFFTDFTWFYKDVSIKGKSMIKEKKIDIK